MAMFEMHQAAYLFGLLSRPLAKVQYLVMKGRILDLHSHERAEVARTIADVRKKQKWSIRQSAKQSGFLMNKTGLYLENRNHRSYIKLYNPALKRHWMLVFVYQRLTIFCRFSLQLRYVVGLYSSYSNA